MPNDGKTTTDVYQRFPKNRKTIGVRWPKRYGVTAPLRAIARYWSEIATFSYPLAFNAPVHSGPWDNRGKCHTVGKRIQCL